MLNEPIRYQLFNKFAIEKGHLQLFEIYTFLIGGQNAHNVGLAVWKTAYVIATIDFIAGNMSTRFLFLFRLTRYFLGLLIGKKKLK